MQHYVTEKSFQGGEDNPLLWGCSSGGFHFEQEGSFLGCSCKCYLDSRGITRTNLVRGDGLLVFLLSVLTGGTSRVMLLTVIWHADFLKFP